MAQKITSQESAQIFQAWLMSMGWDGHGGLKEAASALGMNRRQIERFNLGESKLKPVTRLAMAAVTAGIPPFEKGQFL